MNINQYFTLLIHNTCYLVAIKSLLYNTYESIVSLDFSGNQYSLRFLHLRFDTFVLLENPSGHASADDRESFAKDGQHVELVGGQDSH